MKYNVCFICYHDFKVEAEDEDEAIDLAYEEFVRHQRIPVAATTYDDIEVYEVSE